MPLHGIDPYTPGDGRFECISCGARERASNTPGICSDCGGPVRNIAVSRE